MNLYQWRLLCWTCCLIVLIRCAMKYQSRAKIDHEQLSKITADLIQTEATFARVSRELYRARARSKSRSRSRSARSRRATKTQETCVSPRKSYIFNIFFTKNNVQYFFINFSD